MQHCLDIDISVPSCFQQRKLNHVFNDIFDVLHIVARDEIYRAHGNNFGCQDITEIMLHMIMDL